MTKRSEAPEPIPLLVGHDHGRVVGYLVGDIATFAPNTVTARHLLPAAWQTIESDVVDGKLYVRKARVRAFSIDGSEEP